MKLSDNAMCAVLLCSYIGLRNDSTIKPLSMGEWNSFLDKVIGKGLEPKVIFERDKDLGAVLSYPEEEVSRIKELSSRGGSVAFELDDLNKKGVSVVTLFDADYPPLLKRRLKRKTPPVLFYAGDIRLAGKIGIAVVGSRDVDEPGVEFARRLTEKATAEKLVLYSGGAKGVDTVSETTAVKNGGAAVVYVADSLLTRIKKQDTINSIMSGQLLLITDMKPDTGFSAARAMNRNKFIYASAYGTFVVSSDYNKGGTWAGAVEAIRNSWGKTLIWNRSEYKGNKKLIEKGGIPYELSEEKLYDVVTKKETYEQMDFLNMAPVLRDNTCYNTNAVEEVSGDDLDIYNQVKEYIAGHLNPGLSVEKAAVQFCVAKEQMKIWLDRLCDEGLAECKKGVYSKAGQ